MAQYQYSNNPQTTLSGAVLAGDTSISVASGSTFPARGKFTIIVDSEIMLVTGVSGTVWTVTRGYDDTSAAAHNNNATVTGILTKQSFLNAHHIDVRAFGAAGDGSTNDTTAINAAIAALNSQGGGTLRFPAGTYITSGALTSITVPCTIEGEGGATYDGSTTAATKITCTSSTASLFTVAAHGVSFHDLALVNTAGVAPSAGAGITVTSGDRNNYRGVSVRGFWINIDVQDGAHWTMQNCYLMGPVKYALKIQHIDLVDGGDQAISDSLFYAKTYDSDAAIRVESGGGLKITNCKINMELDLKRFNHGIDVAVAANVATSDLQVSNCSIENVRGNGINITTNVTKPSNWDHITINGVQFALYSGNTTGSAIKIAADAINDIEDVVISGCAFRGDSGNTAAAVSLTNVNRASIGSFVADGFGRPLLVATSTDIAAQPHGPIGFGSAVVDQAGISAETSLTGLSAMVTTRKLHMIRISARYRWVQTVGTDTFRFRIKEGAVVLQETTLTAGDTNANTYSDWVVLAPSPGTHTYNLTLERVIGTGSATVFAAATYPADLVIEDLGPWQA